MKEERAIAILMTNLKGSKKKPSNLLDFAKACRMMRDKWGFNQMSEFFKVSKYQLRQIDKINDLDSVSKKLVHDGKLGIESSYHLWRLDKKKRKEAVNIIQHLTSDEVRAFVNLLHKNPEKTVKECKKEFDKIRKRKVQLVVLPFEYEEYELLKKNALRSRLTIHDYALKLINKSLK